MRFLTKTVLLIIVTCYSYSYAGLMDVDTGDNSVKVDPIISRFGGVYAMNDGNVQNEGGDEAKKKERLEKLNRLDQIDKKKSEIKVERDKLIKERKQLIEDIEKAGVVRKQEQLDQFKKRLSDLEGKLIKFNEEVDAINEEEKKIIEELEKKL